MKNNFSFPQPKIFNRLLQQRGGYYIVIVLAALQFFTTLLVAPIAALVQGNARLTSEQLSSTIIATILLSLISNAILLLVSWRMSRNAFGRLQEWKENGKLSASDPREKLAWREITSLPWRYGMAVVVSSVAIVLIPLILYQAFALRLETDQVIYNVFGGVIGALAIVTTSAIGLERILLPAREILLPGDFETQISGVLGVNILWKLLIFVLALISIGILTLSPLGYREIVEVLKGMEADEALREYQTQSLLLAIVVLALAAGLTAIVARIFAEPFQMLVEVFKKVESGELYQRARVIATDEAGELEVHFNRMIAQLEGLQTSLEKQVAERTAQLSAVNEVGRSVSAILDPDELIVKVANLITNRFGHYYTAIFLVDTTGKWAELKNATGEAGRVLRESRHRLAVDSKSMVGTAISQREARIALDVGAEPVRFNNPLLPYTRSEIALPLIAGERVLGALDVQSTREAAFGPSDIETFQNMANQVAIAIENARLFQEINLRLQELQSAQRDYVREAWSSLSKLDNLEYGVGEVTAATSENTLQVPLALRDEVIGQINIESAEAWSPEERAWVESVATQAAVALENARLMEASRAQANLDRTVAEITTKIWSVSTVDGILQTAAREIGRALNLSETVIELGVDEKEGREHE
jgi:GAF domain-containing protein/HAMP domain-containing protein